MATATFKPTSQNTDDGSKLTVGEELIASTIAQAQAALWRAELSRCLLKLVVAAMAVTLVWVAIDQWIWSPGWPVRLAVLLTVVGAAAWWITMRVAPLMRSKIRADYAAQSLELDMPELRHQLSSYVSLRGDLELQGVRGAVVRSIGARAAGQIKQHRIDIPSEAAGTFFWWIVMAVMLAVVAAYSLLSPKNTLQSAQRLLMPLASIDAPSRVSISDVLPGDTEVLADRPVAISAAIRGLVGKDEPVVAYGVGFAQRTALAYDASTDRYVANVSVPSSTAYQIIAGDAVAGPFQIKTRDVPVASVRQVEIAPPAYTGLPKRISTGGAISGEENSRATIMAVINRAITRARIEFNPRDGAESGDAAVRIGASAGGLDMTVAEDGLSATAEITLRLPREKSAPVVIHSYRIRVWDADGNENPDPITYPVRIIRDLPPDVTIVQPREITKELPINAQQLVEITAIDPDYGLRRIELVWQRGVDQPKTEILWSAEKGERGNRVAEYRFRPEKLGLRVGDRVKVVAAALDNREDEAGKYDPNRTLTQPVEWTIVEPRQLPPPTAPEDGVSESDDEPANSGDQDSQPAKQGGEKSGDGQSGSSDGGEGESEGQKGKSDGQGGESGDEKGEKSEGKSGDSKGDRGADGGAKDGASKDSVSKDGGADGKSGGEPGESAGEDSAGKENGSKENRPDSAGNSQPNREQSGQQTSGEPKSGEQAEGDSMPQADGQQNGPQNGQREPQDAGQGSDQGGQAGGEQPGAEQSQGEGAGDDQPPQHDGDAFEKIRDYLNKKREESAQQPDPSSQKGDGPKQPQDSQRPDSQPGDSQSGDAQGGDPKSGEKGDRGSEKREPSGQPQEGSESGKTDTAKPDQTGNAGEPNRPESGKPGDDGARTDTENAGADKPETGKPGEGSSGDEQSRKNGAGENKPGDGKQGEPKPGDSKPGSEPPAGDQDSASGEAAGDQKPGDQKPGDQPGNNQQPGEAKPNGGEMPGEAGSDAKADPSRPTDGKRSDSPTSQSSGGGEGDGNTSGSGGADGDGAVPPEPVDVEYARKATDLVLDYLDQNRDTPDPELLERLNWTPEELRDFTERWKQLLKSQDGGAPGNAGDAKQVEETLRSLGIRPPASGAIGESRDRADSLRNLRDSGNRPAAPSIYRDAFEAFRRGVNR